MSKNKEQVINFSKVEHSGFQHFFWPETHNESLSFRNKLNKELFNYLYSQRDTSLLYLSHYHLLNECTTVFDLHLLVNSFKKKKISLKPYTNNSLLYFIQNDMMPSSNFFVNSLIGLREKNFNLKSYLNKNFSRTSSIYRKFFSKKRIEPFKINVFKNISSLTITTNFSNFMSDYSIEQGNEIYYYPIDFFLGRYTDKIINYYNPKTNKNINELVNDIFSQEKVILKKKITLYLNKITKKIDNYLFFSREKIINEKKIPKNFWRVSGKNLGRALLSKIVRDNGGEVTGFDHGYGLSGELNEVATHSEIIESDYFVSFHKKCEKSIRSFLKKNEFTNLIPPKIKFYDNRVIKKTRKKKFNDKRLKILYLTNIFQGEKRWADGLFTPDYIAFDFHSRLINSFLDEGFCITHKPHPESNFFPEIEVKNKELFSVEFENFEKIYENYDIFIFDKIKTTALDFARQKKLPCILIPISSISWLSKNEKLNFNKSVFIQEIFRKNNNRIFIDFESLKSKINNVLSS